jgi:hypothetical protein
MQKNELIGDLLNIWIVAHDGREACLIESSNYRNTFEENWNILKQFAENLELHIRKDPNSHKDYPRYLISKYIVRKKYNEAELGRMLGMSYLKSDYGNNRLPRTTVEIWATSSDWKDEDVQIWVEVSLEPEKSIVNASQLVEYWNTILSVFPFPLLPNIEVYLITEKDDGWQMRLDNLEDTAYFIKHYDDYANDVYNYTLDDSWAEMMNIFPTTPEEILIRKKIWLESMDEEINS